MAEQIYFEDVNVGDAMPELVKGPLQKLQFVMYAGASGDFNPLHNDDEFAMAVGMKNGVISHGMLVMGVVGQAVTAWIPQKYLKKFGVRFAGMTQKNSTITVSGTVTDKRVEDGDNIISCDMIATDQNGDVKITGNFIAALPSKG